MEVWIVSPQGGGEGATSDLLYYKSPRMVGVVVKALEGREERQGLDLRRCLNPGLNPTHLVVVQQMPCAVNKPIIAVNKDTQQGTPPPQKGQSDPVPINTETLHVVHT